MEDRDFWEKLMEFWNNLPSKMRNIVGTIVGLLIVFLFCYILVLYTRHRAFIIS